MIELDVFRDEWKRLCRRFKVELDVQLANDYYEFLNPRMSTAQFALAAEAVWSTREFFPPPSAFLENIMDSDWSLAIEAFAMMRSQPLMRQNPDTGLMEESWPHLDVLDRMTPAGRDALNTIGGLAAISEARDVARVRDRFAAVWPRKASAPTALPAAAVAEPERLLAVGEREVVVPAGEGTA